MKLSWRLLASFNLALIALNVADATLTIFALRTFPFLVELNPFGMNAAILAMKLSLPLLLLAVGRVGWHFAEKENVVWPKVAFLVMSLVLVAFFAAVVINNILVLAFASGGV
jgi:hypothetical protein